jgi:hypothetical protein
MNAADSESHHAPTSTSELRLICKAVSCFAPTWPVGPVAQRARWLFCRALCGKQTSRRTYGRMTRIVASEMIRLHTTHR